MDMKLTPAEEAFRAEVRTFLAEKLTPELKAESDLVANIYAARPLGQPWHRILAEKGWSVPDWPLEYGGTGWTAMQQYIFDLECYLAGAPTLSGNAVTMVGPILMAFGTQEQKDYYLPGIRSGDHWWCQGYSEPGAGSDLAALKLRADRDGDHYVLNGSKIWTTHAHWADKIFCLVRTDSSGRPQQGISFLVFDMNIPGITVRPLITISGEHETNQVFFEDVRVPVSALVGKENEGWTVAKYLLTHERSNRAAPRLRARMIKLHEIVQQEPDGEGIALIENPIFASKVANAATLLSALEMTELRLMDRMRRGEHIGAESSIIKLNGSELQQLITELAMEAMAYYGLPMQPLATHLPSSNEGIGPIYAMIPMVQYLTDRAASIYAGSNEIQRNIMAKQVLGL